MSNIEELADMSNSCGFRYQELWLKRYRGEISESEFMEWYAQNCALCKYMNVVCMYGEE